MKKKVRLSEIPAPVAVLMEEGSPIGEVFGDARSVSIVRDMRSRFQRSGSLSDKQVAFIEDLLYEAKRRNSRKEI